MTSIFGSGKIITSDQYLFQINGFLRVHTDGRCERLIGIKTVPTGIDPSTGVHSKDVVISPETNLSVRLYFPKTTSPNPKQKLPVVIYFHGGGFAVESARSPTYHPTLNLLAAKSGVIVVSVDYRLAPEHPLPIGYNDSWEAIKWVATHGSKEPWLDDDVADFQKVFLAGDSAGANIAHNMAIRFGSDPIDSIKLNGIILLHPFFGGEDPIGSECGKHKQLKAYTDQFWKLANPDSGSGLDDPWFNPEKDPNVGGLGCGKILVCVAEKDSLRDRGINYRDLMGRSGWNGELEVMETKGEDHVFFLFNPSCENACTLHNKVCSFINQTHHQQSRC